MLNAAGDSMGREEVKPEGVRRCTQIIIQERMEENLSSDLDGRGFFKEIIQYIKEFQLIGCAGNLKLIIKIKMESQSPKALLTQPVGRRFLPGIPVG